MMGISRLNAINITKTNHHSLSYSKFLKMKNFHLELFLFYVNEKLYFIVKNHTKPPGPQAKREGATLEWDAHGGATCSQEGLD